ncbi:hypothetical protein CYY_002304 [Polysphondylium violaceum]|uniref:Uncharacterized protein n=1 Tax=Polysphondylium violaceum TaxID=133409 RepID=A0A8J4Q0C9_9MYCE|nr:hypothetical protein CYY_002304 [Polysphondylium violaceum]
MSDYNLIIVLPNGARIKQFMNNDVNMTQLKNIVINALPGVPQEKITLSLSSDPKEVNKIVKAIGWTKFLLIDCVKRQYPLGFVNNSSIEFNDGSDSFIMKLYVTVK